MARPRCTPTTHTNALTDAPRSPGSMPSGYKMGSRKKVGWREGLELTGSGIRGAGDASGAAKVRKSQTPSPSPSPGSPACSLGRLLPAALERRGEEPEPSFPWAALPGLAQGLEPGPPPAPAWGDCQARSDLPKDSGGARGQDRSILHAPAAHFFLCRHTPREPPSPTLHAHARVRPSHHPRSID